MQYYPENSFQSDRQCLQKYTDSKKEKLKKYAHALGIEHMTSGTVLYVQCSNRQGYWAFPDSIYQ